MNASIDWWIYYIAWWVEKNIDLLVDIDKDFVLIGLATDWDRGGGWIDRVWAEKGEISQSLHIEYGGRFGLYDFACD